MFYGQNGVIVQMKMNKTKFVGQRMPHPIPSQWSRMGPGERATRAENGDGADHFFRCFLQTGKSKNSRHGRRRPSLVTRRPAHGQQTSGGKEGRTKAERASPWPERVAERAEGPSPVQKRNFPCFREWAFPDGPKTGRSVTGEKIPRMAV